MSGGLLFLGRRSMRKGNMLSATALIVAGVMSTLSSLTAFRFAFDDRTYNTKLIERQAQETRTLRRSNRTEGTAIPLSQ